MTSPSAGPVLPDVPVPEKEPPARAGRLGPVLGIAHLSWMLPVAASHTLLLALLEQFDEGTKTGRYAVLAGAGTVAAMAANIVIGVLSDRTRSRWGRRNPWILCGGFTTAVLGCAVSFTQSFPVLVLLWIGFQIGLNAVVAPLNAVMPDRVAPAHLGKASSWAGIGSLLGMGIGGVAAGLLVAAPVLGLRWIFWTIPVGGLVLMLAAPDRSSTRLPRERFSGRLFARSLVPPRDADLLWAMAGRLLTLLGINLVLVYQLYVLKDYLGMSTERAGSTIALASVIHVAVSGVAIAVSGPLSDRLGRRKAFIVVSASIGAAAVVPLSATTSLWAYFTFVVAAALGFGCFLAVDQAVMAQVLPQAENRARDLGFLNIANTVPSLIAPILAAAVVPAFGYPFLFLLATVIAVAGGLCILPIRRVA